MSNILLSGSATGAGVVTLTSPVSASNLTITLPNNTTTIVGTDTTQTLTNKTITSPSFSGTPTAPTAADGNNTTQVSTTAFVQNTVGGYLSKTGLTGGTITLTDAEVSNAVLYFSGTLTSNLVVVVPITNKRVWAAVNGTTGAFTTTVKTSAGTGVTIAQGKRNLIYTDGTNVQDAFNDFESIALTGTPTAPTATAGTNTTQVATTAFVQAFDDSAKANLASPTFTGTPNLPTGTVAVTQAADVNNTTLATTAFVQGVVSGYQAKTGMTGGTVTLTAIEANNAVLAFSGTLTSNLVVVVPTTFPRLWAVYNWTSGAFTLTVKTSAGTGVAVAQGKRNLVYTDGTNVLDAFNDFESIAITGTPTAPTATAGTNNTQIATTAFVQSAIVADNVPVEMPSGVNLDTKVTNGVFSQSANVEATLVLHYPVVLAGLLEVFSYASMIHQRYWVYNSSDIYTRAKYDTGAWGTWIKVANVDDTVAAATTATTATTATYLSTTQQTNAILGKTTSMSMSQDSGATKGSFICRASGTGDANLAGLTFHNDAYAVKLGVRADGVFGIGGWSRGNWSWYSDASGNMVAAGNVTAYSDPRLKENFKRVEAPFEIIKKLDGGTFTWKHGIPHTECKAGTHDYGILADQVEAVMPEIVTQSIEIDGESYRTVDYSKIIPVLIEAIKELKTLVDSQQTEIHLLNSRI